MVRDLERIGAYRVLRRIQPAAVHGDLDRDPFRQLALLVAGAAGGNEAGAVLATYDHLGVRDVAHRYRTDMVADIRSDASPDSGVAVPWQPLNAERLAPYLSRITLQIDHGATWALDDLRRACPALMDSPRLSAPIGVNWGSFGADGSSLSAILLARGLHADTRTATGAIEAMTTIMSAGSWTGKVGTPFEAILRLLSAQTIRIDVRGPTYRHRDLLKSRGYRWSCGSGRSTAGWRLYAPRSIALAETSWIEATLGAEGVIAVVVPVSKT